MPVKRRYAHCHRQFAGGGGEVDGMDLMDWAARPLLEPFFLEVLAQALRLFGYWKMDLIRYRNPDGS